MDAHPYTLLTPDCVLNALDSLGLQCDGRLLALNSYENRVYQAGLEDRSTVVAKFYRPGRWSDAAILEEHAYLAELAEAELPVVPPLRITMSTLHRYAGFRFAVFPRQGGRVPELTDAAKLARVGRLMARIHAIGALRPYRERPSLGIEEFAEHARDYLLTRGFIPVDLLESYRSAVSSAIDGVRRCFERAGPITTVRLHGDCYAGNILWTDEGPHFVDFDDSRMGPAIQDLWMLPSGDPTETARQLADLVSGYRSFFDFDPRELHLIEALRTLRLIHYAGWLAQRWDDPAFPSAFPWFNTHSYWRERILELQLQIRRMDEPPPRLDNGLTWHHFH